MESTADLVRRVAEESGFAGTVRVDRGPEVEVEAAYGAADRARDVPMTPSTRLGTASGSKLLTALVVLSLVEDGVLGLDTRARKLLGSDLPLVADDVTVEHLLAHRSGIGDYLDEDDWSAEQYVLPVPVHRLARTEDFLAVLDGFPTVFPAGERFAYCNGGYVLLALLAERAAGVPFHDLVEQRVCTPAGLAGTAFLRSDALPGDAALGYVEVDGELRTNVLHLPVRGTGDGGAYSTPADLRRLWTALFAGRIVSPATVAEMIRPRSEIPSHRLRYGLGLWLYETGSTVRVEGEDAGVSFLSAHDPERDLTYTVIGNTAENAWPLTKALGAHFRPD